MVRVIISICSHRMDNTKQQVREFYDQIGWSQVGDGLYQNARYEDLRPVSREYIHKCHLRVKRYLAPKGDILLDAGSGPVQWPEYLTYSENYGYRLCADISITALKEARMDIAVGLVEYWNQNNDFFHRYEIDILSCGNPVDGRKILNR